MQTPQPVLGLAPLHGVTIRVFRNAYLSRFGGLDYAMAPFIPAIKDAEKAARGHFKDILPEWNLGPAKGGVPLVPQLMANDADDFVSTARVIAELGYAEVNWNLGCPFPMVTRKRRGSGLLPHPELVDAFLDRACARSPLPVSVKLRLGLEDADEILAILPVLDRHPLRRVILHPRVGTQMYDGQADPEAFGRALAMSRHPLAYNGDISTLAGFEALRARFPGVGEWMIGRGAIADPFLPARIKGLPVPDDTLPALRDFHDRLYLAYAEYLHGPRHLLDKMKEIWGYLADSFPDPEAVRREIRRAGALDGYRRAVDLVFSLGGSA